jgi:two-component system sensor histidine kinase/response regulator
MKNAKKTVLIIEDSPTQALSLQMLLENEGLFVLHAPDGTKGIQIAQEQRPDAIVLDVEMPGMSGFEVAVVLSKHHLTEGIPIIMLTKLDDTNSLRKSMILGAIDFIPKDVFAETVLLETLRHLKILDQSSIEV